MQDGLSLTSILLDTVPNRRIWSEERKIFKGYSVQKHSLREDFELFLQAWVEPG